MLLGRNIPIALFPILRYICFTDIKRIVIVNRANFTLVAMRGVNFIFIALNGIQCEKLLVIIIITKTYREFIEVNSIRITDSIHIFERFKTIKTFVHLKQFL